MFRENYRVLGIPITEVKDIMLKQSYVIESCL